MPKVVNEGYILEIVSWENDADNYRTKSRMFNTKEEAIAVKKLCIVLFDSSNNGDGGIGNLMKNNYEKSLPIILNYLTLNPELLKIRNEKSPLDFEKEIKEAFPEKNLEEDWIEHIHDYMDNHSYIVDSWSDFVMDYNRQLLGGSEYYLSRIAESASICYLDQYGVSQEIK